MAGRCTCSSRAPSPGLSSSSCARAGPATCCTRGLPIELGLATAPATLRVATDLAAAPADAGRTLGFELEARRSGDLVRWLSVAPVSALPLAARGRLRLADVAWQLDATHLLIGRSHLVIDARGPRAAGEGRGARPAVRVRGELLELPELMSLHAAAAVAPAATCGAPPPALPAGLDEADLELELQQLRLGRPTLQDVGQRAQVRQGRLLPSPFRGRVAGTAFDGTLGLAEAMIDGRAEALQFSLQGRGRDWRTLVEGAELQAQLVGGSAAEAPAPMRVFLNANILFSAGKSGGAVRALLRLLGCDAPVTGDRSHFGAGYGKSFGGITVRSPRSLAEYLLSGRSMSSRSIDPRGGSSHRSTGRLDLA